MKNKKINEVTFLIKDYETFSTDPKGGKVSQFASLRTDENFNILPDKEINMFCKLSEDALPSPMACLITGITPQVLEKHFEEKKFPVYVENRFANLISKELSQPNTCTMGYNNFSFDDEVTRNLFFRNFRDPYAREWQGGNSRFDIYQLVMATYVLRPDLLNFPNSKNKETGEYILHSKTGKNIPSFRLEELSEANGIIHENAHDALNDVRATIGIAKIIKDKDPEYFDRMFQLKNKKYAIDWFNQREGKPFVYISSFFGREANSLGIMLKVADHPKNKNAIIAINLRKNAEDFINLSSKEIENILYSKKSDLEDKDIERVGLQVIKLNQSPMVEDLYSIKDRAKELGLNGVEIRKNINLVKNNYNEIKNKVIEIFDKEYENDSSIDVDRSLYSGGFFSTAEKREMESISAAANNRMLKDYKVTLKNSRLQEMFFRFKGRNYPFEMSVKDMDQWNKFCAYELTKESDISTHYNFNKYFNEINELKIKYKENKDYLSILYQLEEYGHRLIKRFNIK